MDKCQPASHAVTQGPDLELPKRYRIDDLTRLTYQSLFGRRTSQLSDDKL